MKKSVKIILAVVACIIAAAAVLLFVLNQKDDNKSGYDFDTTENTVTEIKTETVTETESEEDPSVTTETASETEITVISEEKTSVIDKTTVSQTQSKETSKAASEQNIDIDKAKQIALADAGVKASDVKFVKAETDYDNGIKYYEIDFIFNSKEYEYEINSKTGKIVDKDIEPVKSKKQPVNTTSAVTSAPVGDFIGELKAKEIALSHAGVKNEDVKYIKAKLDKENGIFIYEVEFVSGRYEYDYEINPVNGKIIKSEKEFND